MKRYLVFWVLMLVMGCPKAPNNLTDQALLELGQSRDIPYAMRGKFSAKVTAKGDPMPGLPGAMILHQPDRFRIALNAPIGGPVFTLISDGTGVGLVLHRENVYILVEHAADLLGPLVNQGVGLESLTAVLLGSVPWSETAPSSIEEIEDGIRFVYSGPEGSSVKVQLHPGGELALLETFDAEDVLVFSVAHREYSKVEGFRMPKKTYIQMPAADLSVQLKFSDWSELAKIPNAFGLDAPSGVEVIGYEEALERLKKATGKD